MIDVTLLGAAALLPLPDRALTAAVLSCGGRSILFDCGEGTQTAARRAGVSLMKTDLIAFTHYHGDHVFGLPGLLQTMYSMGRTDPLYITGPGELMQAVGLLAALAGELSYEVRALTLPGEPLPLAALHPAWPEKAAIASFETRHRGPSVGYCFTLDRAGRFLPEKAGALGVPKPLWGRLQKGETVRTEAGEIVPAAVTGPPRRGLKFVFTGDTSPCETLVSAAKGADLMISEATYGDDAHSAIALERGHMTFSMAARAAAEAGVKRLWLAHFSQSVTDPAEFLPNAAAVFPGAVCGYDGLRVRLDFEEETPEAGEGAPS